MKIAKDLFDYCCASKFPMTHIKEAQCAHKGQRL